MMDGLESRWEKAVEDAFSTTIENTVFLEVTSEYHDLEGMKPPYLHATCALEHPTQGSIELIMPKQLAAVMAEIIFPDSSVIPSTSPPFDAGENRPTRSFAEVARPTRSYDDTALLDIAAELLNTLAGNLLKQQTKTEETFSIGFPESHHIDTLPAAAFHFFSVEGLPCGVALSIPNIA